jgi:glycosyltransferase involved in cell wall biosynthesis
LKIAVAASGLAHVKRGVETWAQDLGEALRHAGVDATTFQGSADPDGPNGAVAGCMRRDEPRTARIVRALRGKGGWRIGLGSEYGVEQTTFALNLFRRVRRDYDILHVQDPQVALIFDRLNRMGLSRPRVILAHGTEEEPALLKKYSYLQHLAPNYLADWSQHQPPGQVTFAIPNFVNTEIFQPGDKAAARAACGLSPDTLLILSVGALKTTHKRMDYLIAEFGAWRQTYAGPAMLVIAGAVENETEAVVAAAAELGENAVLILKNQPRHKILQLLHAADIFTLASRHEMLPMAIIEALATGLPVACNATPTLKWLVGDAGRLTDITVAGALAAQFAVLAERSTRNTLARNARTQAERHFSEQAVVGQMLDMYRQVLGTS